MPKSITEDERLVELQAGAQEVRTTAERLFRYDLAENERHVLLTLFGDEDQADVELALLRRLLTRVRTFEHHAHELAGAVTELLEHHRAAGRT